MRVTGPTTLGNRSSLVTKQLLILAPRSGPVPVTDSSRLAATALRLYIQTRAVNHWSHRKSE